MPYTREYSQKIALRLKLRPVQVAAAIELLDAGNTLPFIARYRKEATDNLDEEQLRQLSALLGRLRAVDDRRDVIVASIEEQGKLTPELEATLAAAETLTELEDLYQPYKPKRRTRAAAARERGLQPLADLILSQARTTESAEAAAARYVSDDVPTPAEALAGARDIAAETISDHPAVRQTVRERALRFAMLKSLRAPDAVDPREVYALYYDFAQRVDRLKPYQVLALNRGENDKVLRLTLEIAERDWREPVEAHFRPDQRSPFAEQLALASRDAAHRLLVPAIERDVRRHLTESAEAHAIGVFAVNLRGLLSVPPLAAPAVLGIDPGLRTGCKVAVVDATGKVLDTATVYPHAPHQRRDEALRTLAALVSRFGVTVIAIGNGTASRETEALAAELTRSDAGVRYLLVSEAGASVYSASELARAELPDLDVTLRGAVSIARRVLDPLAELVKIDPKSIGVGLYQHDVDQKALGAALDGVVESVVNSVGVDVNTASPALLTHVAGVGAKLAEKIVAHREANGAFRSRKALLKVSGLGAKAFEQAAGFLRVRGGDDPLDASAIHPESYAIARLVVTRANTTLDAPAAEREAALDVLRRDVSVETLAAALGTGVPTLTDICEQLIRPGRDPRADLPAPLLRADVLSLDDLRAGMRLAGTVRNVVDFGAFIDIGVKQDGLLHSSQIPRETRLRVGDVLEVQILSVEKERGRIGLGWV